MSRPIIEVNNVSKLYRVGTIGATTLRDSWERWWHKVRGNEDLHPRIGERQLMIEPDHPQAGRDSNTFWALKDITFSVEPGEVLGIIGRNGAGKSTLLKILSRITEPTTGEATLRGRVASLLEVGTGFHPELTGRENIYLNGAILGMTKAEIVRKFREIVAFAEIERFIDTPVKRYSSGMYVRLAFAVAAHLEPEILLVDEVLAVGDALFQKKCLGKMGEFAREGRTVLFVSHNMGAVRSLCQRALLVELGRIELADTSERSVSAYLRSTLSRTGKIAHHKIVNDTVVELLEITVNGCADDALYMPPNDFALRVDVRVQIHEHRLVSVMCILADREGQSIGASSPGQFDPEHSLHKLHPGVHELVHFVHLPRLNKGVYYLHIAVVHPGHKAYVEIPNAVELSVDGYVSPTGLFFEQGDVFGFQTLESTVLLPPMGETLARETMAGATNRYGAPQ